MALAKWRNQRGFSVVEVAISAVLLAVLVVGFSAALRNGMQSRVHAQKVAVSSRLTESMAARLQRTGFHDIFAVDSSNKAGTPAYVWGLDPTQYLIKWSTSPIQGLLAQFEAEVSAAGFDKYTIDCTFVRRDSSDMYVDNALYDLNAFRDKGPFDSIDDRDPNIRFFDANMDGDYYDVYFSTALNRMVSETPDTHQKVLDIYVWKEGRAYGRKHLILSMEKMSGNVDTSAESTLKIDVRYPTQIVAFRQRNTAAKRASLDLVTVYSNTTTTRNVRVCTYPDPVEGVSHLRLKGVTEPQAMVETTFVTWNGFGNNTTETEGPAGSLNGYYDLEFPALTSFAMQPGLHYLEVRCVKNGGMSPYSKLMVYVDVSPPIILSTMIFPSPGATVKTRSPYVSFVAIDTVTSSQPTEMTGMDWNTYAFLANGSTVPFVKPPLAIPASLNDPPPDSPVVWVNAGSKLPAVLDDNTTYAMRAEVADRAGYKAVTEWSFSVDLGGPGPLDDTDSTPPNIAALDPPDGSAVFTKYPEISCLIADPESGVIPHSLTMKINGVVVLSSGTVYPALADNFDNKTGRFFYTPILPLPSGANTVEVVAAHWSNTPSVNRFSTATWTFNGP